MYDERDFNNLEMSAFVGNEAAVNELRRFAEIHMARNPQASADAYRALSEAYRHKVYITETTLSELNSRLESEASLLRSYKAFVTFQDGLFTRRVMPGGRSSLPCIQSNRRDR